MATLAAAPTPISAGIAAAPQRFTVVHSGARDAYQVSLALHQAGLLDELVTDLYLPSWLEPRQSNLGRNLPTRLLSQLAARSNPGLPSSRVHPCTLSGLASLILDKVPGIPLSLRRAAMRHSDAVLGRTAGTRARLRHSGLLSYSYYGCDAFHAYGPGGTLFQLHPHPASMRRILQAELLAHPDCAASLSQEWELALPDSDFERLVAEPTLAASILVASSFTRSTLVEQGIAPEKIHIIPYGVDTQRFSPGSAPAPISSGKLKLLFVGRINQRKGIKYLLEALRLVNSSDVELTVCGRVVDDLALFKPFADSVRLRPDISAEELLSAYREADLFVLPSVAEGFGQVLLESLACGLPILATTRTAAPDLIADGNEGFIVDPGKPEQIAERIEWALNHRQALQAMRTAARATAEHFTWDRFRRNLVAAVALASAPSEAAVHSPVINPRRSPHAL